MSEIRLVLCGVGGVGRNVARLVLGRRGGDVVAACSRNPALIGADVGELATGEPNGVTVTDRAAALATPADVLLIATTSFIAEVADDIAAGVDAGLNVMCTAEEMGYPWAIDPGFAADIDARAREAGVTVMGAGANPGYIYEVLGLALTGAACRVDRIEVRRVVDLSRFSHTVQRRLGLGFEPDEHAAGVAAGRIYGHIGYPHTMRTFARRFGTSVERFTETIDPIPAPAAIDAVAVPIAAGQSAGFKQVTSGYTGDDDEPWFTATFLGHVDLASIDLAPEDSYNVIGEPNLHAVVRPGFNPQATTMAVLANMIPHVVAARPGLLSVTDLPIPAPWG
ncbi:MAG: NADP-binding protein [bacterium]|nr:NADP-binding protein [bacterium]